MSPLPPRRFHLEMDVWFMANDLMDAWQHMADYFQAMHDMMLFELEEEPDATGVFHGGEIHLYREDVE